MKLSKLRPSPAMIVACVALIAAVSGTAFAASMIGSKDVRDDSLRSKDIRNDSVRGKDIAANSVKGSDVKDGKLSGRDVRDDSLKGKDIDESTLRGVDSDTVGGNGPEKLKTRWFLLNEQGQIEDQSGGFTVIDAYDTNTNAYVDAGEPLDDNGLAATIAIQNQIDQDPNMAGTQGSRNGEVAVSRCQIPNVVECAPPGAKNQNALVVSPSNSDGTPAATPSPMTGPGTATKRVYVVVTESAGN